MANDLLKNINISSFTKSDVLKKRVFFTIAVLFVYRLGTYIPIPGLDPLVIGRFMAQNMRGIFSMLDMFSGGSLSRMTIFALNLMPYISASIIIQIMTYASPQLAVLRKEGAAGRTKLNQYTRYLTILIAAFQAYGICVALGYMPENPITIGKIFPLIGVPTLVGGTMLLMWLGEQITSRGIGNGVSLLIYAGIIANVPNALARLLDMGRAGALSVGAIVSVILFIAFLVMIVVFFEKAQRRVKFMYPGKRGSGQQMQGADNTHLPLKLNASGVIPPIFANSLLLLPATIVNWCGNSGNNAFMQKLSYYLNFNHPVFTLVYAALIIFFAFFYTAIVFNSEETAENLKKSGGFIPGVRPGIHTADYFDYILTRITVVGSIYLVAICIFPQMLIAKLAIPAYLSGTSILIVVSVAIDTVTQIYTHLLSQRYEGLLKRNQKRLNRK